MDPSVLGNLVEHSIYSLYLLLLDSLEEYNISHPTLVLTHYLYFQPFLLVHLPSPESQSSAVDILVDFLSIIIVLTLTLFVFPSVPLVLLQSLLLSLGLPQHYLL